MKTKRKITEKDGKFYTPKGVELTRNANTMTEAEFFAMILSALRRTTKFWKPKLQKLEEGKRLNQSDNKRIKYEYNCEQCLGWFKRSEIQLDHIINCGGINGYSKIEGWCKRAYVEKDSFQRLCLACHTIKTNSERAAKKNS